MAYNGEEVPWVGLSVVLSLVKGTAPAKKEADLSRNDLILCLFIKEEVDGTCDTVELCSY